MSEAVTDIIVARAQRSDGLTKMFVWSVAVHVVAVAGFVFMPERHVEEAPAMIMRINLGGPPGPKTDGMNAIGARAVQTATPERTRNEPPPAPVRPKMTLPNERQTRRAPERPRPEFAPRDSTARTQSTGAEAREGSARAETNQPRGLGFGQATAGGVGGDITVDVANFCCNEYLADIRDRIQRHYNPRQDYTGRTRMMFTILKDGRMVDIKLERGSGFPPLDLASERALKLTERLPPLPDRYPNQTLTVHLDFEYRR